MTLASLLVARWFGPELLGLLGALLAGVMLVTMLNDGLTMAVVRFVSKAAVDDASQSQRLGWQLFGFTTSLNIAVCIVAGLLGWAAIGFGTGGFVIFLAVCLAILRTARANLDSTFRALRTFKAPAISGAVCTSGMAIVIIVLAVRGYGVAMYLSVMSFFTACNIVWLILSYRKHFTTTSFFPDRKQRKEFIAYSLPLAGRGLTGFFFLKVDIWIIVWLGTLGESGQFRLVDQFLTIPALVTSGILTAIQPRIAEAQHAGMAHLSAFYDRLYALMLAVSLPVAVFFLFNGYVLPYLFPGFEGASRMLMIFAPVLLLRGISNASAVLLMQGGKPKAAFWLAFVPSMFNVVFAIAGYIVYGVMGLVIGTAIVHVLTYVVTIAVTHYLFKIPFRLKFW